MLKQMFGFRLDTATREALVALAARAERKPGDYLRLLVKREARRAGLLPEKRTAQSAEVSQAEAN